jgi:hypothetical protein
MSPDTDAMLAQDLFIGVAWLGMLAVLSAHMAGPCLPPMLTVALFVGFAMHC